MDPLAIGHPELWTRVDALVERAATTSDLRWHRLHLYASWRWRSLGREIPHDLRALDRQAAALRLAMPSVVARVREAYNGPLILLKGADVAARYPKPELRPSADLDFLVPDGEGVHRALIQHGFREWDEDDSRSTDHHHMPLLLWPGLPGGVEIHKAPNWPTWMTPPRTDELMSVAADESVLGRGIRTLPPAHHTLLLTAHLWRDDPVGRLGPLIDVYLMSHSENEAAIESLARRWGIERLWHTTRAVTRSVLLGESGAGFGSRALARGLTSLRQRTVLESKMFEIGAPFYGLTPARAIVPFARQSMWVLTPGDNETWTEKAHALRDTLSPISVATNRGLKDRRPRRIVGKRRRRRPTSD